MMLDASKERIPGIIAKLKHRLEELARPEVWTRYTKNMECGEYKEFKQSCIDDEIIIAALEKQMPKKPKTLTYGLLIDYGWKYGCPNCGCAVGTNNNLKFAYGEYLEPYENNCCSCGQALDWSDTE